MSKYCVSTYYKFCKFNDEQIAEIKEKMIEHAKQTGLKGLVILGREGINTTFSGSIEAVNAFKKFSENIEGFNDLSYKDSSSEVAPFRRFKVQIRNEIVTLDRPDIFPDLNDESHLSPEEWDYVLKNEKDFLLIDTRNWYETEVGKFKEAICPPIDEFTDFPKWLTEQKVPKDKKVLIYCTGGIRCEKAQVEMKEMGYSNVFQLKDGILRYLEKFPNQEFEGECFVFDHRVAVDQNLEASKVYDLCVHCGQPTNNEIDCVKCDSHALVCKACIDKGARHQTCSKNCANHYDLKPDTKIKPHTNHIIEFREQKRLKAKASRPT